MKCPKCKEGEIKENVNFKKGIMGIGNKKIISYYCPLCDFSNYKTFSMTSEDMQIEFIQRTNLEKKNKITYDTNKIYKEVK